ncbi:MAG: hypothetical protein AAFR96_02325 [Planctomycetota bacterium]
MRDTKGLRARFAELSRSSGAEADTIVRALIADRARILGPRADRALPSSRPRTGRFGFRIPKVIADRLPASGLAFTAHIDRSITRALPRLTPPVQDEVLQSPLRPRIIRVASELLRSAEPADRAAGIAAASCIASPALVPALVSAAERMPVASRAAVGLAIVACLSPLEPRSGFGQRTPDPGEAERAVAAVLRAAEGAALQRDRELLVAALAALSPVALAGVHGPLAMRWLDAAAEPTRLSLRAALGSLPPPIGAPRALQLATRPELRRASALRLAETTDHHDLDRLLEAAHLLRRPLRSEAIRGRLDPEQRRTLVRRAARAAARNHAEGRGLGNLGDIVRAMAVGGADRLEALEPMLASAEPIDRLRLAAVPADDLLQDLCFDQHHASAHAAATRLLLTPQAQRLRESNAHRSPHRRVREAADAARRCFESVPAKQIELRRSLRRKPAETRARIDAGIAAGDPETLRAVRRLTASEAHTGTLAELMETSDDPRAVCLAIDALALAPGERARGVLVAALDRPDPRIRSNAVEALAARARRRLGSDQIGPDKFGPDHNLLPGDDHHRPAATSIRQRLSLGRANTEDAERIRDMLSSTLPERRAAALWVIDRSAAELKPLAGKQWAGLAALVAHAARHGVDDTERGRATRCARRMLAVV